MRTITDEEFDRLLTSGFERTAVHLETRDAYGTDTELPYLAKWRAGEHDDLEWLQGWASTLRGHMGAGRTVRRARVVSEPLSDYQRWSHSIAHVMVGAGEDIRWVPRRRVSAVLLPGNDYYLLDDRQVIWLHYAGSGLGVEKVLSDDPAEVELCRTAFEAAWRHAIRHSEYTPV